MVLKKNISIKDGRLFLNKIFNHFEILISPKDNDFENLIKSCAEEFKIDNEYIIFQMVHLLPRNPRKLKEYLRNIHLLEHLMSRFNENELNINFIYPALLLKSEYPYFFKLFMQEKLYDPKKSALDTIQTMSQFKKRRSFITNDDNYKPKIVKEKIVEFIVNKYNIEDFFSHKELEDITRIIHLMFINYDHYTDSYLCLRLIQSPDIMTEKEFDKYYPTILENIDEFDKVLNNQNQYEYIFKLLRKRNTLISKIIPESNTNEYDNYLSDSLKLGDHFKEIFSQTNNNILNNKYVLLRIFNMLYHAERPENLLHKNLKVEAQNKELLIFFINYSKMICFEMLESFHPWYPEFDHIEAENLHKVKEYYQNAVQIVENMCAKEIMKIFNTSNFEYFGTELKYIWVLLKKDPFYTNPNRHQLIQLAQKRKRSKIVQDNFFQILNLLYNFYHEKAPNSGYVQNVSKILNDAEIITILKDGVSYDTSTNMRKIEIDTIYKELNKKNKDISW